MIQDDIYLKIWPILQAYTSHRTICYTDINFIPEKFLELENLLLAENGIDVMAIFFLSCVG